VSTWDVLEGDQGFSNFVALVTLVPEISGKLGDSNEGLTLFAPSNTGFTSFGESWALCLTDPESTDALSAILDYHILPSIFPSFLLSSRDFVTSEGSSLTVVAPNSVNDVPISVFDTFTLSGVVHTINGVLLPPSYDVNWLGTHCRSVWDFLEQTSSLSVLQSSLDQGGYKPTLSNLIVPPSSKFTLLAPINDAFNGFEGTYEPSLHLFEKGMVFLRGCEVGSVSF
jgi:uncharacterized surface protein with fasciclin (FAS1) repeats